MVPLMKTPDVNKLVSVLSLVFPIAKWRLSGLTPCMVAAHVD